MQVVRNQEVTIRTGIRTNDDDDDGGGGGVRARILRISHFCCGMGLVRSLLVV